VSFTAARTKAGEENRQCGSSGSRADGAAHINDSGIEKRDRIDPEREVRGTVARGLWESKMYLESNLKKRRERRERLEITFGAEPRSEDCGSRVACAGRKDFPSLLKTTRGDTPYFPHRPSRIFRPILVNRFSQSMA